MPAELLVILPALNEAKNLPKTLTNIRQHIPQADVLVINDGSTDDTSAVAREYGALVLDLPFNVGIGAGVQTAFQFAEWYGYRYVVRNDGDGQHGSQHIARMVELLRGGDVDVVIGSRFLSGGDYGTPLLRRTGITLICTLLTFLTQQRVTDPTSGFCAYNQRAIHLFARLYPHDYPEPEAIMLMSRCGLRRQEIPITMQPREHGTSTITGWRPLVYMLKVTLAILINVLRRVPMVN